jgi:hypothetical protein
MPALSLGVSPNQGHTVVVSRVPVGRRQKTAAFDAVLGVVPTPGASPAALNALAVAPSHPSLGAPSFSAAASPSAFRRAWSQKQDPAFQLAH